jgi:hypothetical protein
MLQLYSFLPCEKVIYEQGTNGVSIISVLHDIFVPVIKGVAIPYGTMAPLKWTIFALWFVPPEDVSRFYEQMVVLTGEHNETLLQVNTLSFQAAKQYIRATHTLTQFPIYRPAQCWLRLYLRDVGAPTWSERAAYPITLHHTFYTA